MSYSDYIYPTFIFSAAAIAALALAFTQGIFFQIERKFSELTMALVPILMCSGLAVSALLSGRNLDYAQGALEIGGAGLQRFATVLIIAISVAKIVNSYWVVRRSKLEWGRLTVVLSFLALFLSTNLMAPIVSERGDIVHNSFYPVIVLIALYKCRPSNFDAAFAGLKIGLLLITTGGVILALVKPEMALQATGGVTLPGLRFRFWGLNAHANGAGATSLILMLLLYFKPFKNIPLNFAATAIALITFVLAQSKTMWITGLVIGLVLFYYKAGRDSEGRPRPIFIILVLFIVTLFVAWFSFIDVEHLVRLFLVEKEISQLASATGRTDIWVAAIQIWLDHFWIGYGPDAWGPAMRLRLGMPFALHAHNQLLQVLTVSGVVGGALLVAYFVVMGRHSIDISLRTKGVSVALLFYMIIRSVTEVPLAVRNLFNEDIIVHMFWLMLVLAPYDSIKINNIKYTIK